MFIINSYTLAVVFTFVTMLCWGSWANTSKFTTSKWQFPLYYWDYSIGLILTALVFGLTMGSIGDEGRSMLEDLAQADARSLGFALLGGAVFNLSNLLIVAAIAIAGLSVAFPIAVGLALVLGVLINYMKMDHLPGKGETVTDAVFMQVYGGKGANQAVAAARAGGNVAFVNCVGEDAYTPQMVQNFEHDRIDTSYVFHEKGVASGHALIMIGDEGNNYLSVAPEANYRLTPAKIDEAMPVIDEAAIIVMQYEIPADTIKYVIDVANKKNIPVLWNFAPAREFDLSYIPKVNILVLNEVEAGFLAQMPVENVADAEKAAGKLIEQGVEKVIITLGSKGAFVMTKDEKVSVSAFKVDAVDTTAAGDIFCGAHVVANVEEKSPEEALRFASAAAAISVTRMGAQPSAPSRKEIDEFLKMNE